MKRAHTTLEAGVRAFRDLTATPADGAATRTRVLARAGEETTRRSALRRAWLGIAAGLLTLSSASAAWTIGVRHRAEVPVTLELEAAAAKPTAGGRPVRVFPPVVADAEEADDAAGADSIRSSAAPEAEAYGRAHRAHFVDDAPARALAAWDDYLAAYPTGVFAPEARYNRALCLLRLGRFGAAAHALHPFASDAHDGYRRTEARLLLDWIRERRAPIEAERATPPTDDR
jgi:TolA-binding protein